MSEILLRADDARGLATKATTAATNAQSDSATAVVWLRSEANGERYPRSPLRSIIRWDTYSELQLTGSSGIRRPGRLRRLGLSTRPRARQPIRGEAKPIQMPLVASV